MNRIAQDSNEGLISTVGDRVARDRLTAGVIDNETGWQDQLPLLGPRADHSSVAYNGFLYVIGGAWGALGRGDVLVAPINANGANGEWEDSSAPLPFERFGHSCVAYNDSLYVIGGGYTNTGLYLSDVLAAPIERDEENQNQTPARLAGAYSRLVDLGVDYPARWIRIEGQASPGGQVRLQIRLAPDDTKVFGEEAVIDPAPLGSAVYVAGAARYVWLRLTLDDTGTTDVDQPTNVSEIMITPTDVIPPPSAGVVRDVPGEDIDEQTSTTTIEANWNGFSAAAGDSIASYEWAIIAGSETIQDWINVGPATHASNSSLALHPDAFSIYVQVRAITAAGLVSPIATSDGVRVVKKKASGGGDGAAGSSASGGTGCGSLGLDLFALLGIAYGVGRRSIKR
ncbi:MAG: hypothetical protein HY716_13895 [Planctomycetes bacterium]|nr:hypothetical protein [Planctomycetota bacterium]